MAKPPLGTGERFKQLKGKLADKGAHDPAALAAWIGRKKYGAKKMGELSAAQRKSTKGSPEKTDAQVQKGYVRLGPAVVPPKSDNRGEGW